MPRNITRFDYGSVIGWQVRIKRKGEVYNRFFADAKNGGTEVALEKAVEHRDEMLTRLPPPQTNGHVRPTNALLHAKLVYATRRKQRTPYIEAYYADRDGKRRYFTASVEKWGLEKALWMACSKAAKATGQSTEEALKYAARAKGRLLKELPSREINKLL